MKKIVVLFISIIAFLYLIGENEEITFLTILFKCLSLLWFWLVAKANNYFYERN